MSTVLITGATGFLGSHIVPMLVARGFDVHCLVTNEAQAADLDGFPVQCFTGTPSDPDEVDRALQGCDLVIHADREPFGSASRERTWKRNVLHPQQLARRARIAGIQRFLLVSSFLSIGATRRARLLDESEPFGLGPLRLPAAESTRQGEDAVLAETDLGLEVVVVNPGAIVGAGNPIQQSLETAPLTFCPTGGLNLVDVHDVVEGCLLALEHGRAGHRYILGGHNLPAAVALERLGQPVPERRRAPWTIPALAGLSRALESVRAVPASRSAELLAMSPLYFWLSSEKAQRELGYQGGANPKDSDTGAPPSQHVAHRE